MSMLNNEDKNKLKTYLEFLSRKRDVFVGEKMNESLPKKAKYLFILQDCNEKNVANLLYYKKVNADLIVVHYKGSFPIKDVLGYEKLNAFSTTDINLGKAIASILEKDM